MHIRPTSVYTLPEVADDLGISVRSIQRPIKAGKLNAVRVGLHTFVSGRCLLLWLEDGAVGVRKQKRRRKEATQV